MQKKSNLTSWTIYYWSKSFTLALNEKFEHRVDNWFDAARPTGNGMRWVWIHSNTMYSWIVQWVVRVNRSRTRWILVLMNSKFRVHLTALHFAQLKWLVEIDNDYPSKYCGESRGSNVSSYSDSNCVYSHEEHTCCLYCCHLGFASKAETHLVVNGDRPPRSNFIAVTALLSLLDSTL